MGGINNNAGVAVTQREGLIQLAADRLDGGEQAIGANLVESLFHLVGLLPCLLQQVGLAKLDEHPLGASRR